MGIRAICDTCSHLQNASRARLGLTSIPNTKYNLHLALALHRAGFLASVTRGGPHPPAPETLLTGAGGDQGDGDDQAVTSANVATRRLWLGLKYWDNRAVLARATPVSRPSRLITADLGQLGRIARGFPAGYVKGLNLGECLFLSTDRGVLEVREALERKVGGLVLCRVS